MVDCSDDFRTIPIPTNIVCHDTSWRNSSVSRPRFSICDEPLVRLSEHNIKENNYYARSDGLNYPYCKKLKHACRETLVRKEVAVRLNVANELLRRYGVSLCVLDGFRPIKLQSEIWEYFIDIGRIKIGTEDQATLEQFASRYCSNPNHVDPQDPFTIPVHATGGAVDVVLTLIDSDEQLYFGGTFDDATECSKTSYYEDQGAANESIIFSSNVIARTHRRILYWAMTLAGFTNYCHEWWHFDFQTHLAIMSQARIIDDMGEAVVYGIINP